MLRFKKGELNSNLLSPRQHLRGLLIGSSTMNLIAGCARTMGATGTFGIKNADLPLNCPVATDALLGVRPEHIALVQESPWRGEVTVVEPTGADTFVVVKTDAGDVTVRTSPQTQARPGDAVGLEIQAARVNWFDAGSGVRV